MSGRVVVTGAGGRLGSALVREWRELGDDVIGLARPQLDLTSTENLHESLGALEFDVLVNCAAVTNVDYCEAHPDEAMQVNAQAPRTIAEICAAKGARCIHISTDYVFDGNKSSPYTEEDVAAPVNQYGRSKREGEIAVLEVSKGNLIVRVSWVFGPDRPSFVDQIVQKAREDESVAAIADKVDVPTYTVDAARLLRPLLFDVPEGGLLHLCNAGACTWQEYGQHAINCAAAAGAPLRATNVAPLKLDDVKGFKGRRPVYTPMATGKLATLTGETPRPWQEAVEEYVTQQVHLLGLQNE